VLCIDYRLAPEHPFPAAVDDAAAAYRWLVAEGADPRRMAIMGDSAGGGLTLATLLRLRDEGAALPAAAVVLSPWTDLTLTNESMPRFAEADPMLSPEVAATYARWYLAGADPRNPYASPLYGDPQGLPPTLIQVGSDEILLNDGMRMAERMRAAGCRVELEVWPRMPHVWHLLVRVLPEARRALEQIGAFVRAETRPDRTQACVAPASA
jgi:acetyl esterase/lipase